MIVVLRWICTLTFLIKNIGAFCPTFLNDGKLCTCYNYLDGAVIKCKGPKSIELIEKLKALPVRPEIRELAIERAAITEVGDGAFRNLRIKTLVLNDNHIKVIHPNAFRGLESSLVSLSIAHNKLTEIPTDALTGLNALNVLNLQCNNIGNIYQPVFRNVSRLIELNLACNQICKISGPAFDSVKDTLQSLILDQNCLKEIPAEALRNFKQLLALHLQYNEIMSIDKLQLMNMLSLLLIRLSGNKIKMIDRYGFNNVPNLRYLFLNENELTSIEPNTLQQFKYLEIIDLSHNNIGEITSNAFQGLEHLMQLNLESNAIKDIAPSAFAHTPLLLLLLGHNCLTSINQQMFQGIPFLKQLSLTNNNVKIVQPYAFAGLPTLNVLDLSKNKLQILEPTTVTASPQVTILAQENPMVCGQHGYHIIQNNQPIYLTNESNTICKSDHAVKDDMCPTRNEQRQAPPCCQASPTLPSLSAPSSTTQKPSALLRFTPTTTKLENDVTKNNTEGIEPTTATTATAKSDEESTDQNKDILIESIPISTKITPSLNMERFWRFTAIPRSPIKQKRLTTTQSTMVEEQEEGGDETTTKNQTAENDQDKDETNKVEEATLRPITEQLPEPATSEVQSQVNRKSQLGLPQEPPKISQAKSIVPPNLPRLVRPQLQAPEEPPLAFGPPMLPQDGPPAFNSPSPQPPRQFFSQNQNQFVQQKIKPTFQQNLQNQNFQQNFQNQNFQQQLRPELNQNFPQQPKSDRGQNFQQQQQGSDQQFVQTRLDRQQFLQRTPSQLSQFDQHQAVNQFTAATPTQSFALQPQLNLPQVIRNPQQQFFAPPPPGQNSRTVPQVQQATTAPEALVVAQGPTLEQQTARSAEQSRAAANNFQQPRFNRFNPQQFQSRRFQQP
uniref:Leucine-rich repeat-containing protein let-4 n=1 Tax=Romanomermis culicivorax TaxID=13658 RepID=A0A915K5R2_ROMCU